MYSACRRVHLWDAHNPQRLAKQLADHLSRRALICAWPWRRYLPALLHFKGGQILPNSCHTVLASGAYLTLCKPSAAFKSLKGLCRCFVVRHEMMLCLCH